MERLRNIDRRAFVKGSTAAAAALGALSLVGCAENELAVTAPDKADPGAAFVANEEGAEWFAVPCWIACNSKCVNKVLLKDGVVLRQKTDDTHEDSWDYPQSRGCLRGRAAQQKIFGADRLKYPMKRKHWEPLTGGDKSLRGRDEWERISWDEALDYIAAELINAKEKYGNESILFPNMTHTEAYWGGLLNEWGGYTEVTCTDSLGTFQYGTHLFGLTLFTGNDRYDYYDNTDYIILWGNNLSWNSHGNPNFYLKHLKQAGKKSVYIGPDYPVTAGWLDAEWIPVRPATDTALILGVCHSMLARDKDGSLIDWDFLDRCTVGFDSDHMPNDAKTDENFRDYLMGAYDGIEKTPEWASEICGTPVDKIELLADIMGCSNNCYISCSGGPTRNKGAENYPQALMTLAAMGGHFGKPGNSCNLDCGYSSLNRGERIVQVGVSGNQVYGTMLDNPVNKWIPGDQLWDAILTGRYVDTGNGYMGAWTPATEKTANIKVIVNEANNRLVTLGDTNRGIEAYRSVDFVVTSAYYMKADAAYSDIVLPICTRWEYYRDASYHRQGDKEVLISYRACIEPLYEARPDLEILGDLGKRLGIDINDIYPTDMQMWFNQHATITVKNEAGEYEPLCTVTKEDLDRYGVEGEEQTGIIPFEQFISDGVYRVKRSADDSYRCVAYQDFRDDPVANPLATTVSGKFEIYCQAKGDLFDMLNEGVDHYLHDISALPKYLPQHEGYEDSFNDWENKVQGSYPFQLSHLHYLRNVHTDGHNMPWMRQVVNFPAFINSDDAKAKGIETGDIILVKSAAGAFLRPASVSRCIMPGVIMIPHGAQPCIDEETGIDKSGADNILTTVSNSTSSGLGGWNTVLVDYEKYTGSIELLPDSEWSMPIPELD